MVSDTSEASASNGPGHRAALNLITRKAADFERAKDRADELCRKYGDATAEKFFLARMQHNHLFDSEVHYQRWLRAAIRLMEAAGTI